jgi:hypothetical protein
MWKNWLNKKEKIILYSAAVSIIVTIVVAFLLKVWFWLMVISFFIYSIKIIFRVINNNDIKRRLSILLTIMILLIDTMWGLLVYTNYKIVHNKIDVVAWKVWWFFGFKKWKIVIDNQAWIENIAKDKIINNLDNIK